MLLRLDQQLVEPQKQFAEQFHGDADIATGSADAEAVKQRLTPVGHAPSPVSSSLGSLCAHVQVEPILPLS